MILHLHVVPGFWVAVEEMQRPAARSHPIILGGLPYERGIVREANIPAMQSGVRPGMTLSQAHHSCPDGLFLTPDITRYEVVWEAMLAVLRDYTPVVEPVEMGRVFLDLTGEERRWPDPRDAAREIADTVERRSGLFPCIGIAFNRLVAEIASLYTASDGIAFVDRGEERSFLADLPITLLPDIDPRLALTLDVLGLKTMGDLAALPASAVKMRFGSLGIHLHSLARGIDPRRITPPQSRPVVSAGRDCDEGAFDEAVLILRHLANECAEELTCRHLAGHLIALHLEWGLPRRRSRDTQSTPMLTGVRRSAITHRLETAERGLSVPERELPVPYRIHSMLPQPTSLLAGKRESKVEQPIRIGHGDVVDCKRTESSNLITRIPEPQARSKATTLVRTAITTAPPLLETAQQLLIRLWREEAVGTDRRLAAIKLTISEFEAPSQLSFDELNRIDAVGALRGIDSVRLQALTRGEEALAARYGDTSFRHVAELVPASILTERRFRWEAGLPWRRR